MNASDVTRLLRIRHRKDVFVGECKNGPSMMTGSHSRLDAWVMPRSWSNPAITGYEIKVSRSDFLRDDKWHNYLPMCNALYFACAPGVADPREMPEGVGMLVVTKTGTRLITKKKAKHREIEFPADVFRYVLMSRCRVYGTDVPQNSTTKEHWEEWLKDKKLNWDFGQRVGKEIRKTINEKIKNVESENLRLSQENKRLASVQEFLERNNIDHTRFDWRENLTGEMPQSLKNQLIRAQRSLEMAAHNIQTAIQKSDTPAAGKGEGL